MAKGDSFDEVWEEWSNASLALLREAADRFAKPGDDALEPERVVAALLSILARPMPTKFLWNRPEWPARFFDGSVVFPTPSESLARLAAGRRDELGEVIVELMTIAASSAKEWGLGNPQQPDPREVLSNLFMSLWSRHLIPRPPSKAYPRGV